jgi:hypothetical protein
MMGWRLPYIFRLIGINLPNHDKQDKFVNEIIFCLKKTENYF